MRVVKITLVDMLANGDVNLDKLVEKKHVPQLLPPLGLGWVVSQTVCAVTVSLIQRLYMQALLQLQLT